MKWGSALVSTLKPSTVVRRAREDLILQEESLWCIFGRGDLN